MTTTDIESCVQWSRPTRRESGGVPLTLRTADVTEAFWSIWRVEKDQLKARGYSVGKDLKREGQPFIVRHWMRDEGKLAKMRENLDASTATTCNEDIPIKEGREYFQYQKAGIVFCRRKSGILIADEMGLGKTAQAIGVINDTESIKKVLVVCPASLKINWLREFEKFLSRPLKPWIADTKMFPATDIVIINFDILGKFTAQLHGRIWDYVIIDEAHFIGNPKTIRCQAFKRIRAVKRVALTGTPIQNKAKELYPILDWLVPGEFGDWWQYITRYCGAHKAFGHLAFDPKRSNYEGLQRKMRSSLMIRRMKSEVFKDLPKVFRQVIRLEAPQSLKNAQYEAFAPFKARIDQLEEAIAESTASANLDDFRRMREELSNSMQIAFEEMSAIRAQTGVAKIPFAIEHIAECLEEGHKVVCFAHHHSVISAVFEAFKGRAVQHHGQLNANQKQESVDRFQNDEDCRLFVGSNRASSEGINLTASAFGVSIEGDWVPSKHQQAEARLHRIGQHRPVTFQYLVFDDTIDALMVERNLEKEEIIDRAVNIQSIK